MFLISVEFGSEVFRPKMIMDLFKVAGEVGEKRDILIFFLTS